MKKKNPVKFKTKNKCDTCAERLNTLDETMLSISLTDIQSGNVGCETLYPLINMVGYKLKNHPDFQNTAGKYIAEALIAAGDKISIAQALMLERGSRHKNNMSDEIRIALRAWHKINIHGEKSIAVFKELATPSKGAATVKKLYDHYKHKITRAFESIK